MKIEAVEKFSRSNLFGGQRVKEKNTNLILLGIQRVTLPVSDSTAQYIQGDTGKLHDGLVAEGLQCVAVLIGVYDKNTGLPVIGVANQPFSTQTHDGRYVT